MPTDTPPRRGGNPNWVKGVSGNPGGRPKAIVEVQELARLETAASIRALVRVRDSADTPAAAVVAAATVLLDRGWGKPMQSHELHHHLEPRHLSDDELVALAAEGVAAAAASENPEQPPPLH
jgi:hypothetical protein